MKKRLLIWVALSVLFVTLPAQNAQDSVVTKKFAERLQNLSASYFAYSRMGRARSGGIDCTELYAGILHPRSAYPSVYSH